MKLVFLLLLSLPCLGLGNTQISSIFSFGNSYTDTGNLLALGSMNQTQGPVVSDFPPYGMNFFHEPTGRFCDGRLIIDFIAQAFNIPLLPPYLAHNGSYQNGANFAVSGTTGLDLSFFVERNASNPFFLNTTLDVQLEWFMELKPQLCTSFEEKFYLSMGCLKQYNDYINPRTTTWIFFRKSLFIVGEFGINDFSVAFMAGKTLAEVRSYVPYLVKTIEKAVEKLIKEGALTIVVSENVPFGCLPSVLSLYPSSNEKDYDPQTGCLIKYNELSLYQNKLLRKAVTWLRLRYPYVRLIIGEYYRPMTEFVKYPKQFGFIETPLQVCCGGGGQYNFNIIQGCGMPGVNACQNPSTYLYWDGPHLTEAAYHYIADGWLRGPYADLPILTAVTEISQSQQMWSNM